jgi:hypothetical protein
MKRSAQIGLLVMGALTTTSAAGYFAANNDRACQERALSNPQGTPPQDCRRSVWHWYGHGSGGSRPIFAGTPSSTAPSATSSHPSSGTSAARGGFGSHGGHGGSSGA